MLKKGGARKNQPCHNSGSNKASGKRVSLKTLSDLGPFVGLTDCLAASVSSPASIPEEFVFLYADVQGCLLGCTQLCL